MFSCFAKIVTSLLKKYQDPTNGIIMGIQKQLASKFEYGPFQNAKV
jgi:hypothetical protein